MRAAVIGAGIIGVTTAYELAAQGHEVTVFDRRGSVAEECSFANAGVVAPGYVTPWAAPGMAWKVLRHLFSRDTPVRLDALATLPHLPWLWRWWRACRPAVHAANRTAMHQLARLSQDHLLELTRSLKLSYEQTPGYLVLLRSGRELAQAQRRLKLLQELGVAHDVLDAAACLRLEPGLNPQTRLQAGIHLRQDGVGNCRQFAQQLKAQATRHGAEFCFDTPIRRILPSVAPEIERADGTRRTFDAVVVCAGVQANALLQPLGLKLPLAAVHGYSVTAPLRHIDGLPLPGPHAALMDERYKVAISRLGQRVRVSGTVQLGGRLEKLDDAPLRTLYKVLDDWFPGAALVREAQHWKGARPMLPDGPPVLGASGVPGVWLNLGHGSSGWALACGSARVLAEQLAGREAPLDIARLGVARLR
jgi:D-amino-acid dehydrogenase